MFMLNSLSSIIQLKQNHPGPTQKLFIGEQHLQKEKYVPLVEPCESFIWSSLNNIYGTWILVWSKITQLVYIEMMNDLDFITLVDVKF